jgi:acrylyl-CoA reductase (NADPH)
MDLPATVAPFILRGVALLGVDSVMCSLPKRISAWERLARDMDKAKLASLTTTIPFEQAMETARQIVEGKVRGRTVVEIP